MTATTKTQQPFTEAEAAAWTAREEAEIRRLQNQLERARKSKNRGNEENAKAALARLERGRRNRTDNAWRQNAIGETVNLAHERGEMVETEGGRVIIASRDGLQIMRRSGHIDEGQYAVGLLYRAGHEARGRDLKAQEINDSGSGAHDNDHFVAARLKRARMLDFVAKVDRAVALGCISNPSALQMIRSVAGEGKAITVWGHGRALARNRDALVAALDIAQRIAKKIAQERVAMGRNDTTS